MNFTPGPSAPSRGDYAREYSAAKPRASGLSARSNRPQQQVPTPQAVPLSRAPRPRAQTPVAHTATATPQPQVQMHPRGPRPPDQLWPRSVSVAQRYVLKADYTLADFEGVPFSITDEIALHFNHTRWLTDLRNIREPWMTPVPRSRPAFIPVMASLIHPAALRPIPPPSTLPAAPLSHSDICARTTQPHSKLHAERAILGQFDSPQVPAHAPRQISIISISSSGDDDNQFSSHTGNQDPDPAGEWLEPEESM